METTHGKTAKIKAHLGNSIETLYMYIYESNQNKFAKIGGGGGQTDISFHQIKVFFFYQSWVII